MKKVYILTLTLSCCFGIIKTQGQASKNEYRGNWIDCNTWVISNCSNTPGTEDLKNTTVEINGYVYRNGDISFTNNANLNILTGDTLVVFGSLEFKNNANLNINSNAVLVVIGDIISKNNINVAANGSVVVLGDLDVGKNTDINGGGGVYVFGTPALSNIRNGAHNIHDKGDLIDQKPALAAFINELVPGILPVTLLYFKAATQTSSVKIDWASLKAWDFSHYELERSTNGKDFSLIATVDADEFSEGKVEYSYTDFNPAFGTSYYRLKAVDIDGKFEYKGIEVVKNGIESFKVFPNPSTNGYVTIDWSHNSEGAVATLKDTSGRTVRSASINAESNKLDTEGLSAGIYLLCVQGAAGTQQTQLMIR